MISLVSHAFYTASPTTINVSSGVSLLVGVVHSTISVTTTLDSASVGGESATVVGGSGWDRLNIDVFRISNPTAGSGKALSLTFSTAPSGGYAVEIFEFSGASSVDNLATFLHSAVVASTSTKTVTVPSLAGRFCVVTGSSKDDNATNTTSGVPDAGFDTGYTVTDGRRQLVSGYVASLASASEAFDLEFNDDSAGGGTIDGFVTGYFTVVEGTALTADSITGGTIRAGDTVRVDLSNSPGTSGYALSLTQGALTATAETGTYVEFTAPDLKTFGDKTGEYNTNLTLTVELSGESDTITFQIAPDVDDEVGAITALEGIYAEPEFSGVAVTDLYYTATISGADFAVGAVPVLETEQVFQLWIQDQTDGVWGDPFMVTIPGSATGTANRILHPVLKNVLRPVLRNITEER